MQHDSNDPTGLLLLSQLRRQKSDMQEELLVKLGAKEEKFDWHPDILYRRMERPRSSVVADYSIDIKVGRPKLYCVGIRNPWACGNQALRQMTMTSKQGPRSLFFSQRPTTTNERLLPLRSNSSVRTPSFRLTPISLGRSKTTLH